MLYSNILIFVFFSSCQQTTETSQQRLLFPIPSLSLAFSMLIDPGGNGVWKLQGDVDFNELKQVIVGHEMIGRYYGDSLE